MAKCKCGGEGCKMCRGGKMAKGGPVNVAKGKAVSPSRGGDVWSTSGHEPFRQTGPSSSKKK